MLPKARVLLTPRATRDLERLPMVIHARVLRVLDRLGRWPEVSGARPLSGKLARRYRVRTGDWRVQFAVKGHTVVVERIGRRDRFYEG